VFLGRNWAITFIHMKISSNHHIQDPDIFP